MARRLELAHFLSFALTQSGRVAALGGDQVAAEAALTEAIEVADAAGAGWFAAHGRAGLAELRRRQGDPGAADALLRQVAGWSHGTTSGAGRVTFFRRLAGDPLAPVGTPDLPRMDPL